MGVFEIYIIFILFFVNIANCTRPGFYRGYFVGHKY